ncbi:MAG TPA: hypothetical protein VJ455_09930, partial [Ignavibacteria bacterium]|nr:hypothetical protein [Ignavibacteria bacterium]
DKLTAVPYINYLYNTHKLVSTGEEKYFYALKNIFHHKYTSLGENDKRNLFSLLGNYCYVKTNTGELKFVNEQFVIIKTSIEHGYYKIGEGFISHLMFMNTVITGLEAGETGWVKNFIEKYKIELDHINRENTYIFCKALIYYWEKDYNKALDYAAKIKTGDTSYKHQIKSLYLKIYFDLPDTESFYLHIDSYKHFISADSNISKQVNTALGNYINYAKKIFDLKMKPNTEDADIELLKREIIKNKAMVNKPWLLRKIEELFKSPDQYSRKAVIPSG